MNDQKKILHVRLATQLHDAASQLATQRGLSLSSWISNLIAAATQIDLPKPTPKPIHATQKFTPGTLVSSPIGDAQIISNNGLNNSYVIRLCESSTDYPALFQHHQLEPIFQ